jgi:hypothetical protein
MKIAITTSGIDLDAPVDPRFGRAKSFIIYDTDSGQWSVLDNAQNLNAAQGAGIQAATAVVKDGGLGDDISDLPAAGAAPEWMSEKAISIGHYFVSSGVFTVFGVTWPTTGSEELTRHLFKDFEEMLGGKWAFEPDPVKAAGLMIAHIDKKRKALGLEKKRERVLYDMAMRRELGAV